MFILERLPSPQGLLGIQDDDETGRRQIADYVTLKSLFKIPDNTAGYYELNDISNKFGKF